MNTEVLSYIVENAPERIEELAAEAGVDSAVCLGLAAKVIAEKGDTGLSDKQRYVFNRGVRPLIESVPCEGVIGINDDGQDTCVHGGIIDDESLLLCYQDDEFMCQNCRYDAERMESAD